MKKEPRDKQLNIRVPSSLVTDIETVYEKHPRQFGSRSECVVFLLEDALKRHLPAGHETARPRRTTKQTPGQTQED